MTPPNNKDDWKQSQKNELLPYDGAALGDDRPSDMVDKWLSLTPTEQSAEIISDSDLSRFMRAWIAAQSNK